MLETLRQCGFDAVTAQTLSQRFSAEQIQQQIHWLPARAVSRNRLGMLRRAIEENWPQPSSLNSAAAENSVSVCVHDFVRYFYAGLAGNPGEPVAPPSANDIAAAAPYVIRLLALWPDETRVSGWGRAFGAFVQTSEQQTGKMPRSFVVALRVCGDAFYLDFRTRRQREARQAKEDHRRHHEAHYQAAYEIYLTERETLVQQEHPDLWAAFVQQETTARQALEMNPTFKGTLVRIQLRAFDTVEQHRDRLRTFFRDIPAAGMVDFQEWDTRYNRDNALQPETSVKKL